MNKLEIIPGGQPVTSFDNLTPEQIRAAQSFYARAGFIGMLILYSNLLRVTARLCEAQREIERLKAGREC